MADNFTITPGTGKTIAADDISSVFFQRIKLIHGADGVNDGDVSATNPFPIKITDGTLTASIRDTGSSDALNVAIVDASGNQITSFGGGTEYTEDAAAAANPIGKAPILVRQDTPAGIASADGDNVAQRGTNYGAAFCQILTSSGAFVDSFGGGTQYTEDAASAANPVGNALIGRRRDTLAGETSADGDNVALNATDKGELYVKHVDEVSQNTTKIGGNAISTVASGVQKVGVSDSTGAALLSAANALNSTGSGVLAVQVVGQFDDTAPTSITENQFGNLRMSANRNLYTTLRDAAGNERGANIDASNRLTVAEGGAALTSLQLIDDIIVADNAGFTDGTTKLAMAGFIYDEVAGTALTENDAAAARINANRALIGVLEDSTTRGRYATVTASNALKVDGSAVTQPVSVAAGATTIGKAEDVASADADVGVPAMAVRKATPANTSGTDGDYEMLQMSAGRLWVDGSGVTLTVAGAVAHDAVDSGNPQKVGGQARQTNPTAVADADRVNAIFDDIGRQVVTGSIRDLKVTQQTTITSSTAETTVLTAGGAGVFLDVYGILVANTSATTCAVSFKDSTAGTTRLHIVVPGTTNAFVMLPESGAINQATANNNWTATCTGSVASINITMLAVKNV